MKTTKKLTALAAAFVFAFAFAVVNPQKVQAVGYNITFDPAGSGTATYSFGVPITTSAEEGYEVFVEPTAVPGKYVTSWTASPKVVWSSNEAKGVFKMPAADVTLTPIYESQTAYNLDLSGGKITIDNDASWGLVGIYYPGKNISVDEAIEFDLDKDGKKDVKINFMSGMIEKMASTNLTGTYSVTEPNISPYSPINFKFGESVTPTYTITEGADQTYTKDSNEDVVIKADGDKAKLTSIKFDEAELTEDVDYTVASGSTILTLKASFLNKQAIGNHTVQFAYNDGGSVSTNLAIVGAGGNGGGNTGGGESNKPGESNQGGGNAAQTGETTGGTNTAKTTTPKTGDNNSIWLFMGLVVLSVGGVLVTAKQKKQLSK